MRRILNLSINKQIVLLSSVITFFCFLISSFCFFINHMDIPLGILLGGISSIIPYILFSIKENKISNKRLIRYTIAIIILMSVLHIAALVLAFILTYVCHIHLFNIFATFGAIFIGVISNVIINIIDGRRKRG